MKLFIEAVPLPNVAACFYVRTENELSWRFSQPDVFAGCTP